MRESELDMVRRHVAEGRARIRRQREIIDEMAGDERDVADARALLATLEHSQRLHEAHLAELLRTSGLI